MMSDKDNNLLKSDILTVGSELSEKLNAIGVLILSEKQVKARII